MRIEGGPGLVDALLERLEIDVEERHPRLLPRREAPQRPEREVDAVHYVGLPSGHRGRAVDQVVHPLPRAGIRLELARALAPVGGTGDAAHLLPRHAEQGVVDARLHRHGRRPGDRVPATAHAALVHLAGLPRRQAARELLGKARGIGRGPERLHRQARRGLVMLAATLRLQGQRQDHVGLEGAHALHHVAERLVVAPLLERLLDAERVAELVGEREILLDAVVAVKSIQLLGPQDAERLEQLGADRVLAAFAAREREKAGADPAAAGERDEDAVVLVVGVRGDVKDPARDAEPAQRQPQPESSPVLGDGRELGMNDAESAEETDEAEGAESAEKPVDHDAAILPFAPTKPAKLLLGASLEWP